MDAAAADDKAAERVDDAAASPVETLDPTATPVAVPAESRPVAEPSGPAGAEPARIAVLDRAGQAPDVRDRLLAMLLPDSERALDVVGAAERARDSLRAARRDVAARQAELGSAVEELVAQGLSPAQVTQLLGLTDGEAL